jgi:hypothetical protein
MAEQIQKSEVRKENRRRVSQEEATELAEKAAADAGRISTEELLKDTDALLDEIDEMIANNELVDFSEYIQKGGE